MAGNIDYIVGTPTNVNPIVTYTETRNLYDTVDNPSQMLLRRPFTRQLHMSGSVISVPQRLYGESIGLDSVRLTDDSGPSTIILQDDGYGNLYDVAFSASYASRTPDSNMSGSVVGNIFYDDGIMVLIQMLDLEKEQMGLVYSLIQHRLSMSVNILVELVKMNFNTLIIEV